MQSNKSDYHTPVLLNEVIEALAPMSGSVFIDATMGGGGHTKAFADLGATILAIDQDDEAIAEARKWQETYAQVKIAQGSFENITEIAHSNGITHVNGILFDLGVSSHQLNEGNRGFSFLREAPLDMRMNVNMAVTAADLVNALNEGELDELFKKYGEERFSRRIAHAIVQARRVNKIVTTKQLADVVSSVIGGRKEKIHPATRVFQALRIAVNDELVSLEKALPQSFLLLNKNGKLAVISFHSLEDRIVKTQFRQWIEEGKGEILTKKPIIASEKEVQENPRARSAKLRVITKI